MDRLSRIKKEMNKLPADKQLEFVLSVHEKAPQLAKDKWMNDSVNKSTVAWKSDVVKFMIKKTPLEGLTQAVGMFMDAINDVDSTLHDKLLLQLYEDAMEANVPVVSTTTAAAVLPKTGVGLVSPPQKRTKMDRGFSFSIHHASEDASLTQLTETPKGEYGTTALNEAATENEFKTGEADFIARMNKRDAKVGYNLIYAILSILNYVGVVYDHLRMNIEHDPYKITVTSLTDTLTKYNVIYQEINTSYENIIVGNEYEEEMIILVFTVHKHLEEQAEKYPSTWKHFCLYFQDNQVLLPFNPKNTNYKIGTIVTTRKHKGTFEQYANRSLHKLIYPVVNSKEGGYAINRKMEFHCAFVIHKR